MPQGVAIVDDDKVRRMEEQMRIDPRIATLYGKREEAKATAEKKKAEVESLEKTSRSTADPKAKQETDALLAEAKKALAEAQEEDRKATEEISRAEKEWKAVNDAKARCRAGSCRHIGRRERSPVTMRDNEVKENTPAGKDIQAMGKKILLMIMVPLLFAAPAWAQQDIPEAAKKHLLAGIDAVEKAKTPSDFDRVLGEFEAAAKIAPDSPDVYYFIGKTLSMTRGRTKQAIDAYKRYLALAPNAPDAAKVKAEIADLEKLKAWSRKSGSIGMAAVALPDGFYLRSVYGNSPATAAGLRQGDKIVAVDGRPTKGLTLMQFSELLDGAPGSTCTMDVVRGTPPMKVSFKRTEPSAVRARSGRSTAAISEAR